MSLSKDYHILSVPMHQVRQLSVTDLSTYLPNFLVSVLVLDSSAQEPCKRLNGGHDMTEIF